VSDEITIKLGRISDASDDSEVEQIRQVETVGGKSKPVFILLPPGFCTNIPVDSTILMLSSDGQSEIGVPAKPEARFGNLKLMEVKVGNISKRSNVFFCDDGEIYMNPAGTEKAADWFVQYTEMKSAFDQLKSDFNALVSVVNSLVLPVSTGGTAGPPSPPPASNTSADMSDAKTEGVRAP
jgi:hypothetical protein